MAALRLKQTRGPSGPGQKFPRWNIFFPVRDGGHVGGPGLSSTIRGMNFARTFFVTSVTWQRVPLFRWEEKAGLMLDILMHYRDALKFGLHEFVIMPDHLHLLLTPASDLSLERAMQLVKGGFSYQLGKRKRGPVWQESFTNHRIRDEEDFARHAEYIRMNPVRAGLVSRPELYRYSSAGLMALPGRP
jgi:putative transposase